MDRLGYMLSLMQSLQMIENECNVNFLEQRRALKEEIDKEVTNVINNKEFKVRRRYETATET